MLEEKKDLNYQKCFFSLINREPRAVLSLYPTLALQPANYPDRFFQLASQPDSLRLALEKYRKRSVNFGL